MFTKKLSNFMVMNTSEKRIRILNLSISKFDHFLTSFPGEHNFRKLKLENIRIEGKKSIRFVPSFSTKFNIRVL